MISDRLEIIWPHGHKFAFTIFDDTDWATVQNVQPVYDLLLYLGMRTTKSVWVLKGDGPPSNGGMTCEDREYLDWIFSLQRQGFEIGIHGVAPGTSYREQTRRGLARFRELFGDRQIIHCNHVSCQENIYWGDARLTSWRKLIYNLLTCNTRRHELRGHIEGSPLFWGDLCQEQVRYVRNFVFDGLNTLAVCPEMPYHDPSKPYVNFWFASADGASKEKFLENFSIPKIDQLEKEGGLCIAYVHFAARFTSNGQVDPEFRQRMEYIASKDGWFAPVSEVLDFLRRNEDRATRAISARRRGQIETRWLVSKIISRGIRKR
jgi:hypothetical protein